MARWLAALAQPQQPCAWMIVNLTQTDGKRMLSFLNSALDRIKTDCKNPDRPARHPARRC